MEKLIAIFIKVNISGTPKCGGELWANNNYQTITSADLHGNNIHCVWRIRVSCW